MRANFNPTQYLIIVFIVISAGCKSQTPIDLEKIGLTVIMGPDTATIIFQIPQKFSGSIERIQYDMDEHDIVLKTPTQTRVESVGSQLQLGQREIIHLPDSVRIVIHCKKPI